MDYEKNLNYIRYLNGLYSIRKIIIYNEGDEPAKDLKLGLTFTPEFAQSWGKHQCGDFRTGDSF